MYSYTDHLGMACTILFRHVTSVFQQDASDTFMVYLDDFSDKPVEVPSECYDGFMEKLGEYITRRG